MNHTLKFALLLAFMVAGAQASAQQTNKTLSVGIFVYPGVEILDFSGPSEVFGSTPGFKPFVIAFKKEPVVSQGFITITPQYSIDDCPPTDILVFPGGGTQQMMKEEKLIEWIKKRAESTQIMMSVCTGAGLLSRAGLLDGKEVTTFHGFLDELQRITPNAKVLPDTRYVDDGRIISTAGVSAGIDGALHVVAKIKGPHIAEHTAAYMEYDRWQPKSGKLIDPPFMADVRKIGLAASLKKHQNPDNIFPLFYPGELTELAISLIDTKPNESEAILRHLIKTEASSPFLFDALGKAIEKSGETPPPQSAYFLDKLAAGEVEWAIFMFEKTRQSEPDWLFFTEDDLNRIAYKLVKQDKLNIALHLFSWATKYYPASPNAWDSLAECLEMSGNYAEAFRASEKCLSLIPGSGYRDQQKKLYEKVSNARMERLKSKL